MKFNIVTKIKALAFHIKVRRKTQFISLIFLTIFAGFTEIISIASVVPFVSVVTGDNFLKDTLFLSNIFTIDEKKDAIIFTGLLFSSLYLLNSLIRILLIYFTARLTSVTTAELTSQLYKAKLYENYSQQISKNSSDTISVITQKVTQLNFAISSIVNLVSSLVIFICIMLVLVWVNPTVMLISVLFFGTLYLLFVKIGKKEIYKSSQIIDEEQNNIVLSISNGLGSIRDIILDNTQKFYLKIFNKSNFHKAKREAINEFIQQSPRYIFESMGIVLFVVLLIYSSITKNNSGEFSNIFPTLATLALGSQRILPLLNKLYTDFVAIKSKSHQIDEILKILNENKLAEEEKKLIVKKQINFKNVIKFQDVSFSYDKKKNILENINLEIKKGSRIGIIGKTGEGKSTFLDLLMGFLQPDKGNILIDNEKLSNKTILSWQGKISHVPQKIFLSDSSFLSNIAFGREESEINLKRVNEVSKKSQIHNFIMESEKGYNQKVGERGVKLSGGQIQRIGLARALYKNNEIIIFDEATNSLDNDTEKSIMDELYQLDEELTVIIVAHRQNTLKKCDVILEIKNKKIIKT